MAKVIIHSKGPFSLGSGHDSPTLKPGRNEVPEDVYAAVKDEWFMSALESSGAITIERPPEPAFPLAEVEIGENGMVVIPPVAEFVTDAEKMKDSVATAQACFEEAPVASEIQSVEALPVVATKVFAPKNKTQQKAEAKAKPAGSVKIKRG